MKKLAFLFCCFMAFQVCGQTKAFSPEELAKWQSLGLGNGFVSHGQFLMEEVENSKGFMLVSPEKYEDVVLRYETNMNFLNHNYKNKHD